MLDGTTTLTDGVHKFNEEGIQKICKYVNVDLNNLVTRGKKLEQLSNEFTTFGSDEKRDSIKFITMLDSIKTSSKEETNENIVLNNEDENK